MTAAEFVKRAIGIPFRDGGRDWSGWDCWGLIHVAYREVLGIELPLYGDVSAHDLRAIRKAIAMEVWSREIWREAETPALFDVAAMKSPPSLRIDHVGLYLPERREVLHVERASYTVREPVNGTILRGRIMGYWRHAGS